MPSPSRAPTHKPIDHRKLMKLGMDLEDLATDGVLSFEAIDEFSIEQGVSHGTLYAAAAVATELTFSKDKPITVRACAGNCQQWGAIKCLDAAADLLVAELDEDNAGFNIVPTHCLDQCQHAPVVLLDTDSGTVQLKEATPEILKENLTELLRDSSS